MKRPLGSRCASSRWEATAPPDPLGWLEPEAEVELTSLAVAPADRRRTLRSLLITVAVVLAGSVGVVIGRSTMATTTSDARPPVTTLPELPTQIDHATTMGRLTRPTSAVPTQTCRYLLAVSVAALHTDAAWWIGGVIDRSARLRQPLDRAVRDDLVAVRDVISRSPSLDAGRSDELTRLEAAIALAGEQPCSIAVSADSAPSRWSAGRSVQRGGRVFIS